MPRTDSENHYRDVMRAYLGSLDRSWEGVDRPLLVGQAPGRPMPNSRHIPLFPWPRNRAGGRFVKLSGLTLDDRFIFEATNVVGQWTGKSSKGDKFDVGAGRENAKSMVVDMSMNSRTVLFVGKATASCFDWTMPADSMTWSHRPDGGRWAWIHHTSGIVQHWNKPGNKEALAEFVESILREVRCETE